MSRQINLDEPLSDEDRMYLADRDRYREIEENDRRFGAKPKQDDDNLEDQIAELNEQLAVLHRRKALRDLAVEQDAVGVKDNTAVDGEGGEEEAEDNYDDLTLQQLKDEIAKRNTDRDPEERISMAGKKAELVERLREDDETEADETEADEADDEDEGE